MAALLFNDGFCIVDNLLRSSVMSVFHQSERRKKGWVMYWIENVPIPFFYSSLGIYFGLHHTRGNTLH